MPLDDKSLQRYKLKINTLTRSKRRKFQTVLVDFDQCSHIAIIVDYFLFLLSPLTKKEQKACQVGVLQSVHIRIGQASKNKTVLFKTVLNYLLKLPWLLDGSAWNAFPSPFYCSMWVHCVYCFR